jgi:thiol-disulfide isomerase/thioredoxin
LPAAAAADGLTRLVLAAVFAVAGAAKLADRAGTRKAVVEFGAPERLAAPLAGLLPAAELGVAALLLLPGSGFAGRVGALALLLLFSVAVGVSLARGRAPECHCFGQLHSAPASWKTLARNGFLAGLALAPVAAPWTPDLGLAAWLAGLAGAERLALALGAALAALVTAGVAGLLSLLRAYGRVLVRLERVEAALHAEGIELDGDDDAVVPQHGLQPGSHAPAFSVASVAGETVTLDALLAPGLPLFLLFTSPRCGPCQELLPIAADWQRKHADRLTVAFASEGDLDEVRAEAKKGRLERVLHDEGGRLYRSFRANGTPSAVVVASDGSIATFVAGGQGAIERLLARVVEDRTNGAPAGLPPGAECPALELPSLDGAPVALASLRGRDSLLVFWNSSCGFCRALREDLLAFEASAGERDPRLVLVCMGDAQAMRDDGFRSLVLFDADAAAGALFGARGTPMAVLVSADGRVGSPPVAGAEAVLALATAGRRAPLAIRMA